MTRPSIRLTKVRTDDVEAVDTEAGGWSGRYVQLGRGRLGYRSRRVDLPGVSLRWHACEPRVLSLWHNAAGGFALSWVHRADGALRYRGADVHPDEALFQFAGREHHVHVPAGYRAFQVEVSAPLVAARGWRIAPRPLPRIPAARRAVLESLARDLVRLLTWRAPASILPEETLALRDRVLDAVEQALPSLLLDPGGGGVADVRPGAHSYGVVEAAVEQMRALGPDARVHVPSIAEGLSVSERTLYQAFRDALGVGPYEFHCLERIHRFRGALASGPSFHGQISRAALAHGFDDPSRLTQMYRRQFSETPRQTLQRWHAASGPHGRGSTPHLMSAPE